MSVVTWGMIGAGIAALVAGLFLVRARFVAASGAGRILVLGPVYEAAALAIFAAEHFLAARDLMVIVPALDSGTSVLDLFRWRGSPGGGHQLHRLAVCALLSDPTRTTLPDHRRYN